VPADLYLDPSRLRAVAAALDVAVAQAVLAASDPGDLAVLASVPGGAALVAEHDRLTTAVAGAVRELTDLAARLTTAASTSEAADGQAARTITGVGR
jgi:Excreted virulence factor EspC, type VII ESX diderm